MLHLRDFILCKCMNLNRYQTELLICCVYWILQKISVMILDLHLILRELLSIRQNTDEKILYLPV
jgi:hypothetical protein